MERTTRAEETVLVVDDEPHIREVCQQTLQRVGYDVTAAADGETALQALESDDFDAAVLDIVLPDTDGLQLLREIKQRDETTVVVLVTGFASLDTAMEAMHLGAYEYVRKPFGAADLVRIVNRGLEQRRLKGENDKLLAELRRTNEELVQQQDQMRERMQLATDDLTALVELGQRLSEETSLRDTLRAIMRAGMQVTHARASATYRVEGRSGRLRGLFALGMPGEDVEGVLLSPESSLLARVAQQGTDRIENDILAGPIVDDDHLSFLGVQSLLASPLMLDEDVTGVMAFFDHEEGAFTEDSLHLVRVLSGQAARVIAAMDEETSEAEEESDGGFVDLSDLL